VSDGSLNVEESNSTAPLVESTLRPGRRLRQARESAGLSVDEVAQALKFSPRQIEALERDDFSALKGATFVRGFIRSYAKMLKVDSAPLLASLQEATLPVEAKIQAPENTGAELPTVRPKRNMLSIVVILMVLLLGGFVVFMVSQGRWTLPTRADVAITPPPVAPPVAQPQVRVEPTPPVETRPEAAVPAAPMPDDRQLIFVFDDKSWVEVKDAAQRIIFTGEYPAGSRQSVSGKAPFQLWVGKASGVKVFDGERQVDLKPHTRDEVARLTID
jgi:cytoskeleton protein RodZ